VAQLERQLRRPGHILDQDACEALAYPAKAFGGGDKKIPKRPGGLGLRGLLVRYCSGPVVSVAVSNVAAKERDDLPLP
jgi:hypothetical protein